MARKTATPAPAAQHRAVEYHHSEAYQAVLREALQVAKKQGVGENILARDLQQMNVDFDRTSILRFRTEDTKFIKDSNIAKNLWDILLSKGVINTKFLIAQKVSSEADLAFHLNMFFETHDSQFQELTRHQFSGTFFGYKKSFRRPGSIIKSLFVVRPMETGYFSIHEHQHLKAEREADNTSSTEDSQGIGLSKSARIWLFLKEVDFEQPRVFCFDGKKENPATGAINIMYGYCLEASRKFGNGVFYSRAMLVRAPASGQHDYRNRKLIAKLRSECDLFPVPEFRGAGPYISAGHDELSSLHPEIEEYIMKGPREYVPE
jgi:hypothetical protein